MEQTAEDTLQQRYLLHHEFMHALGFLGYVSPAQMNMQMFNYATTPYVLNYTSFDKHIMLLLYNYSIKAGMKGVRQATILSLRIPADGRYGAKGDPTPSTMPM